MKKVEIMKKSFSILFALTLVLLVIQGCSPAGTVTTTPQATATVEPTAASTDTPVIAPTDTPVIVPTDTPAATDAAELILTLEELAAFDGKNGNPAYIAVDGVIYDVTNVPQWRNGDHNGFTAGHDLTEQIKNVSPHGLSKLTGLPVVGKLAE